MSIKRWKLGWKRCDCVKCEAALTIEQTEEDCGWVRWGDHKAEVERSTAQYNSIIDQQLSVIADLKSLLEKLGNTDPDRITGSDIVSDPTWSIACFRFHRQRERAEIARLRKAGDNLERVLTTKVASYEVANASHEWRAAKEGKQP